MVIMFQFHNGSIKRNIIKTFSMITHASFNSTMVRLKVEKDDNLGVKIFRFQFHNGSIKRRRARERSLRLLTSFNSTMVRLKGMQKWCDIHADAMFQFHNGSIKSAEYPYKPRPRTSFQFHNGSIKSIIIPASCGISHRFQFHNGSIKSDESSHHRRPTPLSFNSTMVRLKALYCFDEHDVSSRVSIPQWFD